MATAPRMEEESRHDLSLLKLSSVRPSSRKHKTHKSPRTRKQPRTSLYNQHHLDQVGDFYDGVSYNVFDPHGRLGKLARTTAESKVPNNSDEEEADEVASIDSVQIHAPSGTTEEKALDELYPNETKETPPVPTLTVDFANDVDNKPKQSVVGLESLNLSTIAESNGTTAEEMDREHVKRANMLTNLLLDMKTNMKVDHNIVDPAENLPSDQRNNRDNAMQSVVVSRSTYLRAEKVKSMLAIKYLLLQRTLDWANANDDINPHRHVEGVYNPLQIIRNRRIRAKYKEYPRPLSFKELPLASNVFSKYALRDQTYRMLWSIDLTELIGDSIWRTYHWDELKNPHGKPWFPPEKSTIDGASAGSSENLLRLNKKLYDKIFRPEEESVQQNTQPSALSVDDLFKPIRSKSSSPVRERIRDKINIKKKKKKHGESTSDVEKEEVQKHSTSKNSSVTPPAIMLERFDQESSIDPNTIAPPTIVVNPETPVQIMERSRSSSFLDINDVTIKPLEKDKDNEKVKIKEIEEAKTDDSFEVDDEKDATKIDVTEDDEDSDEETLNLLNAESVEKSVSQSLLEPIRMQELEEVAQIRSIMESLALIRKVANIRLHYYYAVYPHLANSVTTRITNIINNEIFSVQEKSKKISTQDLPAQERMYITFLDQIQDMLHMINDKYSIRVDSLLSTSDRSIGELNTSVSLEVRKVNERLDKLHNQLLGRSIRDSFGVESLRVNYRESGGYQILYTILENSIVIILRLIWVLVNIYKALFYVVSAFWAIIRFIAGI